METKVLVLLLLSIINTGFGVFLYLRERRSWTNFLYGLAVINIGLWSFGLFMFFAAGPSSVRLWSNLLYFFGSLIVANFFVFSLIFPAPPKNLNLRKILPLYAPNAIFLGFLFFSDLLIKSAEAAENGTRTIVFGPVYLFYIIYFALFLGSAFALLFQKYFQARDETVRVQLSYVISASFIMAAGGSVANIILPTFGNFSFFWAGPYVAFILVFLLTVAIFKHNLFNIKAIITEFLVSLIWIFLLARFLLAGNLQEFLIDGGVLAAITVLGILIIRNVSKEVLHREQLEFLTFKLEEANRKLKKLDETKSEFISIASHQLRSPLGIIKGYLSLLGDGSYGKISPEVKEIVNKLFYVADELAKLVSDLLDLSRMEMGTMGYDFKEGELGKIVEEAVEEYKVKANERKVSLEYKNEVKGPQSSFFDADKMREVVMNLIDNAVKYSPAGEKIRVFLVRKKEKSGEELELCVRDRGIGISEHDLAGLFTKFSRSEDAKRIDPHGMGLGLYILRRIVENHGGRVWAESEGVGKGSSFFVRLPVGRKIGDNK